MGVVLWYAVEFDRQDLTVSSDVTSGRWLADATITVSAGIGRPTAFTIDFAELPVAVLAEVLAAHEQAGSGAGVPVRIRLGYLDDPDSRRGTVLEGVVDAITTTRTALGVRLQGYDRVGTRLLGTRGWIGGQQGPTDRAMLAVEGPTSLAALVGQVAAAAGVTALGDTGPAVDFSSYAREAEDALRLLQRLAEESGAELLVQEEGVQVGPAVRLPVGAAAPGLTSLPAVLAFLATEETLVTADGAHDARLAAFTPLSFGDLGHRVLDGRPDRDKVGAFDFTVLGQPGLRVGQLVVAGVAGYADPLRAFRIVDLTHAFSAKDGYTCTGRAVGFRPDGGAGANRDLTERGRAATPATVADRIRATIREAAAATPSVDAGRVVAAKPAARTATIAYRPQHDGPPVSASVRRDIPADGPRLPDRPLAAPFAWHRVGLSVPVYEGMRGVLAQVRDARNDAVVAGFVWTEEPATPMEPPPARDGDWWLCLPTGLGGDGRPAGAGSHDLVAADGRRVIEAPGLAVRVGTGACTGLGERPAEGAADELVITHAAGTVVRIDSGGAVSVDAKGQRVQLKGGGVSLTLENGKVSIS